MVYIIYYIQKHNIDYRLHKLYNNVHINKGINQLSEHSITRLVFFFVLEMT